MQPFTLLAILAALVVGLWLAQPWINYYIGFAKPKADIEVAYIKIDVNSTGDECEARVSAILRNIGGADADSISLNLVLTDAGGRPRANQSIEAGSLAGGRSLKNISKTVITQCSGFYEDGKLLGKSSLQVTGFQTIEPAKA